MKKQTSKTKELNNTLGTLAAIFFIIFLCLIADDICGNVDIQQQESNELKSNYSTFKNN